MSFSWNKWRQFIIEEASVNEEVDGVGEVIPFFHDAMKMNIIKNVDYQRAVDAGGESEDLDAFESTQGFQQIGQPIVMAAVNALEKMNSETHYLHQKFGQGGSNPIDAADISNSINILKKGGAKINPEADEVSPEDLEASSDYFDNLEEDKFDNPGWDLKAIMDSFKEDFEEATRDTDDIVYAQERVIAAYKDVFAKSHPKLSREIDMYLNNEDAETRKMFQNVADDPEVRGTDMMGEVRDDDGEEDFGGDPKDFGNDPESRFQFIAPRLVRFPGKKEQLKPFFLQMTDAMDEDDKVAFDTAFVKAMQIMGYGDMLEEINDQAIDEAVNEMALDRAMEIANKLDTMQNDLEATLSDDEIDALSDAIMLLRKKKPLSEKQSSTVDPILKAIAGELEKILSDKEVKLLTTLSKERMNESPLGSTAVKLAIQYALRTTLGPIILGPLVKKIFAKMATKFPEKEELILKMEPIAQGAIAAGKIGSIIELTKFVRENNSELAEMLMTMSSELATLIKGSVKKIVKKK
jgi:hypothetical protein